LAIALITNVSSGFFYDLWHRIRIFSNGISGAGALAFVMFELSYTSQEKKCQSRQKYRTE